MSVIWAKGGDAIDAATISRHPPIGWEKRPPLIDEIEAGQERMHEIEAAAGKARKVWTLGTMGDLLCLDAETGKLLWSKNFPKDYGADVPMWGFAAHPLLVDDLLVCLVGGKGSVAVAFHKDTGKEVWRALSAGDP